MKNKKVTAILLLSVLFIWGFIVYKIYNSIEGRTSLGQTVSNIASVDNNHDLSFSLHNYTRDPFLSILTDTATKIELPKVVPVSINAKPFIPPQYCGQITNSKGKVAILKRDKKYFFVTEGGYFENIKIKKIMPDTLVVLDKGSSMVIKRLDGNADKR